MRRGPAHLYIFMSPKKSGKPYISFSRPINHLVVGAFGVAFVLIYAASAILLYLSDPDTKDYYLKAGGMFLLYLVLYILCAMFISRRIWQMFIPIDRLAIGLMRDEVFVDSEQGDLRALADSLKKQGQQMDLLARELKTTKADLQDASRESRENLDEQYLIMSRCLVESERVQKKISDMNQQSGRLEESMADALLIEKEIKDKKTGLYDLTVDIEEAVGGYVRQYQDLESEFHELGDNYRLLEQMHSDAEELIESIYSELNSIQAYSTQINLYAVNTSLDIARAGASSISAISALDEVKELTSKLTAKTDDVLLLIIRIRNAIRLAKDQTTECSGKGEECSQAFDGSGESLDHLLEQVHTLLETNDGVLESVSKLSSRVFEMKLIEEKRERESTKMSEAAGRLQQTVREWKSSSGGTVREEDVGGT